MNKYRIIGGSWRSRKLTFPDAPGLRPTPDRVRETVFNWLQDVTIDADCLDLFAGSGAMGFEAISRYANSVIMIDNNESAIHALQQNVTLLDTDKVTIKKADALKIISGNNKFDKRFDIVFLDPPYNKDYIKPCCQGLDSNDYLKPLSYIYIEAEYEIKDTDLPDGFNMIRNKSAGNVNYHLIKREV